MTHQATLTGEPWEGREEGREGGMEGGRGGEGGEGGEGGREGGEGGCVCVREEIGCLHRERYSVFEGERERV